MDSDTLSLPHTLLPTFQFHGMIFTVCFTIPFQVNSYLEFKRDMLPRIRHLGYNAIQIMAIQESEMLCSIFCLCLVLDSAGPTTHGQL